MNYKVKLLCSHLNCLGLKKESSLLLKIALTSDEDVEAKAVFNELPEDKKREIRENFSIYKTLSEQQRLDLAHGILDYIGLVPGPGDVADFISMLMYIDEKKYELAAISLLCLIPAIGTVFGLAAKGKKVISSRIIYENSDKIKKIIADLKPVVPRMGLVEKAVDDIITRSRSYSQMVVEPNQAFSFIDEVTIGAKSIVSPESLKDSFQKVKPWFGNPEWVQWSLALIRNELTVVLKDFSRSNFAYLSRSFSKEQKDYLQIIIPEVISSIGDNLSVRFISKRSREVAQEVGETASNITPPTFSLCTLDGKNILINLPGFDELVKKIGMENTIKLKIIPIISNEIWRAIDSKVFEIIKLRYPNVVTKVSPTLSGLSELEKELDIIRKFFNLSESTAPPTEIFVRIKALRRFLGKEQTQITPRDLYEKIYLANPDYLPAGIEEYSMMLRKIYEDAWDIRYKGSESFTILNKDLQILCDAINNMP